ncbi:MAG: hypothetical protein IJZ94_00915 [Clostridia bacterium]|nr:hypothetical protein [Clostridia bacterium]
MKNKKYRPVKIWIVLSAVILIGLPFGLFLLDGWKKIVMLLCVLFSFFYLIICLTYWFEVKEDRILIRQGLSSFDEQYRSDFKTRTIMIENIKDIDFRNSGNDIIFTLNDGNAIYFTIGGYCNRTEIVTLISEIKKQIY